jgi:protein involved in polysaccharide export with SLBB domain
VQIPVAGIVRIDTMSEQALIAYLSTLYVRYLPFPNLQVRPLVRLSLLGGFRNPGLYYLSARASVWDAIALAGGPAREDGLEKIRWERGHACMKSDMVTLIETGTSLAAAGIVSGDRFCVTAAPRRDRWEIFRSDVVPVLSLSISAVATGATLYVAYQAYHGR